MLFKGIITGLVLSLSTAAFATPSAPAHGGFSDRVLPDHAQQSFKRRPPATHWQTLSTPKRMSAHRAIRVNSSAAYSRIKLEAATGTMFVDKVLITFGNGATQLVDLDKRLSARNPVVIDLNGMTRKITKVEVYGRGAWRSSFKLLAV